MRQIALVSLFLFACSGPQTNSAAGPQGTNGTTGTTGSSGPTGKTTTPPVIDDPSDHYGGDPHALLTLTLSSTKTPVSESTSITPSVIPTTENSANPFATTTCTTTINGCEVYTMPTCAPACAAGTVCSYDTTCKAKCQASTVCETKTCADDEYCVREGAKEVCKKNAAFDAGKLKISGLPKPSSFSFPYETKQSSADALFVGGESTTLSAPGASEDAGFEAFTVEHKVAKALTTELSSLVAADVLKGTGDVAIKWTKGSDAILIVGGGSKGTFACKAQDSKGAFTVTRDVLDAALQANATSMSLLVTRTSYSIKTGLKLKGTLADVDLPAEGWAYVNSSFTELTGFAIQGPSGASGPTGALACEACITNAQTGTCASDYNACVASPSCKALVDCLLACPGGDFTCYGTCNKNHPDNSGKAFTVASCIGNACSGSCPQ